MFAWFIYSNQQRITRLSITPYLFNVHSFFFQKYTLKYLKAIHANIENLETADKNKQKKITQVPTLQNNIVNLLVFYFPMFFTLHRFQWSFCLFVHSYWSDRTDITRETEGVYVRKGACQTLSEPLFIMKNNYNFDCLLYSSCHLVVKVTIMK